MVFAVERLKDALADRRSVLAAAGFSRLNLAADSHAENAWLVRLHRRHPELAKEDEVFQVINEHRALRTSMVKGAGVQLNGPVTWGDEHRLIGLSKRFARSTTRAFYNVAGLVFSYRFRSHADL